MSIESITVEFKVQEGRRDEFLKSLQVADENNHLTGCLGFRADDFVNKREALIKFVGEMEIKLRRNDHKTTWRDQPIIALIRLMKLEIAECDVALEFFTVAEARKELVDISNFALINWDRLGMLDQDRNMYEQLGAAKPTGS